MAEKNPYAEMTLEELEALDLKTLSLDELWMLEPVVKKLSEESLSAFVFWLKVVSRLSELKVKAMLASLNGSPL